MTTTTSSRYSEADLAEFKARVENLLSQALEKLERLEKNYQNAVEDLEEENDSMDDSSIRNELEVLNALQQQQRQYILDLRNALQRIYNKSYGICAVTGELIDKRRLLAMPTSIRSVVAENSLLKKVTTRIEEEDDDDDDDNDDETPVKKVVKKKEPIIISRIIRKPVVKSDQDEEDDDDEDYEDDLHDVAEDDIDEGFDFDSIAAEDNEAI